VLDTTFQLYKASVMPVLPLCILLAIATTPPSIYMLMQGGAASATDPMAMLSAMFSLTYLLIYLVSVAATLWAMGAIYLRMGAIGADGDLANGAALQMSLGRVPHLFAAAILFAIALVIGLALLIVPGLILMVSLLLCFNLVMQENKGPVDALTGSHKLVWGNWWRTAAVLTVGFIIVLVLYVVVGMIVGVLMPLFGATVDDVLVTSMLTNLVVGALLSLLLTPFYAAMVIALYWDLKLRKEGGDLAARVGALKPA
jgi:hypothetical protein